MGIKLNDTLQFADDQAIIANCEMTWNTRCIKIIEEYAKWYLTVNTKKTNTFRLDQIQGLLSYFIINNMKIKA